MPRTLLFCDLDLQFHGYWWPLKGHIFAHFGPVLIFSFSETEMLTDRQKTNKQRNYTNFESNLAMMAVFTLEHDFASLYTFWGELSQN